MLAGSSAFAAENLDRECKVHYEKIPKIAEANEKFKAVITAYRASRDATSTYQGTCASYMAGAVDSQSTATTQRLFTEGNAAVEKRNGLKKSVNEALPLLKLVSENLKILDEESCSKAASQAAYDSQLMVTQSDQTAQTLSNCTLRVNSGSKKQ